MHDAFAISRLIPPCARPAITVHPRSATAPSGQSVTLSVTATGAAPLLYQWYSGASGDPGSPRTGATGSTLTLTATSSTSAWVRVYNDCGSADSLRADITTATCSPAHGDLNQDGQVNASDAVILANYLAGNLVAGSPPFTASSTFADLDSSGSVNSVDSVILANYLANNITCLPRP